MMHMHRYVGCYIYLHLTLHADIDAGRISNMSTLRTSSKGSVDARPLLVIESGMGQNKAVA